MAEFEEKFSETVRGFPVLYDKECPYFKDKNKKQKAWETVAETMGMKKEEAMTYFRNLRNKYSREKKKVRNVKVSGTGKKEVDDMKSELSDLFPYLQWLDPYVKERKTKSNFVVDIQDNASDSEHDANSESDITMEVHEDDGVSSDTSPSDSKKEGAVPKSQTSWKFHKHTSKDSKKKKIDREEAEFNLIKSLGESIVRQKEENATVKQKDDNDIFGELIASQLRQLSTEKNIMVKMQISNLIYQNMMPSAANLHMGRANSAHYSHSPIMMDQGNTYMSL